MNVPQDSAPDANMKYRSVVCADDAVSSTTAMMMDFSFTFSVPRWPGVFLLADNVFDACYFAPIICEKWSHLASPTIAFCSCFGAIPKSLLHLGLKPLDHRLTIFRKLVDRLELPRTVLKIHLVLRPSRQ
jgi:hypothetical protein